MIIIENLKNEGTAFKMKLKQSWTLHKSIVFNKFYMRLNKVHTDKL